MAEPGGSIKSSATNADGAANLHAATIAPAVGADSARPDSLTAAIMATAIVAYDGTLMDDSALRGCGRHRGKTGQHDQTGGEKGGDVSRDVSFDVPNPGEMLG